MHNGAGFELRTPPPFLMRFRQAAWSFVCREVDSTEIHDQMQAGSLPSRDVWHHKSRAQNVWDSGWQRVRDGTRSCTRVGLSCGFQAAEAADQCKACGSTTPIHEALTVDCLLVLQVLPCSACSLQPKQSNSVITCRLPSLASSAEAISVASTFSKKRPVRQH